MKKIVYLAGLPRSGSTLLANVLAMHSDIESTPSSPLCHIVQNMRRQWSDDAFLLAQLDHDFDRIHKRLKRSTWSFMQSWFEDCKGSVAIDKNRAWIFNLELLRELDPDFKIIITLRDLKDVYASIENRHSKTLFLDFPDHMEHNIIDQRANAIFSDGGIVGSILAGIKNVADIPDIIKHIYYWRYEDFLKNPQNVITHMFDYLDVRQVKIDYANIVQSTWESDSHYRMKYPHRVYGSIIKQSEQNRTRISPRILSEIESRYSWYYDQFYPDAKKVAPFVEKSVEPCVSGLSHSVRMAINDAPENNDMVMIRQIEEQIRKETAR